MLEYRQSLSIHNKIGTFSRFSSTYRGIGVTSKLLGRASYATAPVSVYLDHNAMQSGQISQGRFAYRTTGLGMSIIGGAAIGAEFGGTWGAAGGAFIGLGVTAGEIAYDGLNWLWNETERQIGNFENAISSGWYPGM